MFVTDSFFCLNLYLINAKLKKNFKLQNIFWCYYMLSCL